MKSGLFGTGVVLFLQYAHAKVVFLGGRFNATFDEVALRAEYVKDVKGIFEATTKEEALQMYETGHGSDTMNETHFSLQEMSTAGEKSMLGDPEYVRFWHALAKTKAGTGDFSSATYADDFVRHYIDQEDYHVAASGSVTLGVWMFIVHELHFSYQKCMNDDKRASDALLNKLELAAAYYFGANQTTAGTDGFSMYSVTQRSGVDFDTLNDEDGEALSNKRIVSMFKEAKSMILNPDSENGSCLDLRRTVNAMIGQMTVPLVQKLIKHLYDEEHRKIRQYAMAIVPLLEGCSPEDFQTLHDVLIVDYENFKFGDDFDHVLDTLEFNYPCLGVTCEDIGSYGDFYSPCKDPEQDRPVAGYTPETDIRQRSRIDLDILQIRMFLDAEAYGLAEDLYYHGRNSITKDGYHTLHSLATSDSRKVVPQFHDFQQYFLDDDYGHTIFIEAIELTGKFVQASPEQITELAVKAMQYMVMPMYMLQRLYEALEDCNFGSANDGVGDVVAIDQAWAAVAGSIEGDEKNGYPGGQGLFALSKELCKQFDTCNSKEGATTNDQLLAHFVDAQFHMSVMDCPALENDVKRIAALHMTPLIQGALSYAINNDKYKEGERSGDVASGYIFSRSHLPHVMSADSEAFKTLEVNFDFDLNKAPIPDGPANIFETYTKVVPKMDMNCDFLGSVEDFGNLCDEVAELEGDNDEESDNEVAGSNTDTSEEEEGQVESSTGDAHDFDDDDDDDDDDDEESVNETGENQDPVEEVEEDVESPVVEEEEDLSGGDQGGANLDDDEDNNENNTDNQDGNSSENEEDSDMTGGHGLDDDEEDDEDFSEIDDVLDEPLVLGGGVFVTSTNVIDRANLAKDRMSMLSFLRDGNGPKAREIYEEGQNSKIVNANGEVTDKFRSFKSLSTEAADNMKNQPTFAMYLYGLRDKFGNFESVVANRYADTYIQGLFDKRTMAAEAVVAIHVWIYTMHRLERSVNDCHNAQFIGNADIQLEDLNDGVLGFDEAAAYYIGTGQKAGDSDGPMLYALAERMAAEFGEEDREQAKANGEVLKLLNQAKTLISFPDACSDGSDTYERLRFVIDQLRGKMTIPLIQGLIKSMHDNDVDRAKMYAISVVPQIAGCSPSAFEYLKNQLIENDYNAGNFAELLSALQSSYRCLKITCDDIGAYKSSVPACERPEPLRPIAGYIPSSEVREHSQLDLDIHQINIYMQVHATEEAMNVYMYGRNSMEGIKGYRTLQSLATLSSRSIVPQYQLFKDYFEDSDYADSLIMDVFKQQEWSRFATSSPQQKMNAVNKALKFHVMYMTALRELYASVDDCNSGDPLKNAGTTVAWDEAAAYIIGSMEGEEKGGDKANGQLLYAEYRNRCREFRTCNEAESDSRMNELLMLKLMEGKDDIHSGNCEALKEKVQHIEKILETQNVQATAAFALENEVLKVGSTEGSLAAGDVVYGSVAPLVKVSDDLADRVIKRNMEFQTKIQPVSEGAKTVFGAFAEALPIMGIECAYIGTAPNGLTTCLDGTIRERSSAVSLSLKPLVFLLTSFVALPLFLS